MRDPVSISATDLELVTGGVTPTCSTNDQLMGALQGLQHSLGQLNCNNNNNAFGGNNALLFMTMAMCMSRRNDVYIYGGGRCGGWGYGWRSCW